MPKPKLRPNHTTMEWPLTNNVSRYSSLGDREDPDGVGIDFGVTGVHLWTLTT